MGKKRSPKFESDIECPDCGAHLKVRHYKETVEPAVPAQYEEWGEVESDKQRRLELEEASS